MPSVGKAFLLRVSECGWSSLGVTCHLYVWYYLTVCGIASGVAWPYWVWRGLTGCGMASLGVVLVAWPQWVWKGFSEVVYSASRLLQK